MMLRTLLSVSLLLSLASGYIITDVILQDDLGNTLGSVRVNQRGNDAQPFDERTFVADPSRTLVAPLLTQITAVGPPLRPFALQITVKGRGFTDATFTEDFPSGVFGMFFRPCVDRDTADCSCRPPRDAITTDGTLTSFPTAPQHPADGVPVDDNTLTFTFGAAGEIFYTPFYAFGEPFQMAEWPALICIESAATAPQLGALPYDRTQKIIDTGALMEIGVNCRYAGITTCPYGDAAHLAQVIATPTPNALLPQYLDFFPYTSEEQKEEFLAETTKCEPSAPQPTIINCECYNPNTFTKCCASGGTSRLYDSRFYKCCVGSDSTIVRIGDHCPCLRSTLGTNNNISTMCPGDEPECCLQSKYPELQRPDDRGFCYNPDHHKCCDTGFTYDAGVQQCCVINGIQSLNVPCPCTNDTHCGGSERGSVRDTHDVCCKQVSPAITDVEFCTKYANYPNGTGAYQAQRCHGTCIDTRYQLCCNGASCAARFEKCCNSTCCNRYVGTCTQMHFSPYRQFQAGFGANWLNTFEVAGNAESDPILFETCSHVEQMDPLKAFWLFIFPAALLATTLVVLALALVFANKAAQRLFSLTERAIIAFSILISILIIPLYFSPLYKYGLFIVILAAWNIITASLRVRWMNTVAIILHIALIIYLFDPFAGSAYFNLTYFRNDNGTADYTANGIWHGTKRLYFSMRELGDDFGRCVRYFDYFYYDQEAIDYRFNSPRIFTFGYCSDQYLLALYLFQGFIIICAIILLTLLLIGRVLRFRKNMAAPIELEVLTEPIY